MLTWVPSRRLAAASVTLLVFATGCSSKVENSQHVDAIRQVVEGSPKWVGRSDIDKRLWRIEQEFYKARGYMPAWVDGDGTTEQWKDLVQQLKYAERHGLDPASYDVSVFEELRAKSQSKTRGTASSTPNAVSTARPMCW